MAHGERRSWGDGEGIVLYIAMIIVITLALVGTIGVRSVQFEIATARNVKESVQARFAADTGNMVSIREFGLHYSSYRKWMSKQNQDWFDFDTDYFSAAATPIFVEGAAPGDWSALGYTDMRPGFSVRVEQGIEMGDAAGYAVTGTAPQSFCFRRYTFTSLGTIIPSSGVDASGNSAETIRATATIGPVVCGIQ